MRSPSPPDASPGEVIARAALSYCGTTYHLRGRIPGAGLDCLGVVVCAYRAAGISIADSLAYRREPQLPLEHLRQLRSDFVRLYPDSKDAIFPVQPGDVLYWRFGPQGHLGIVADAPDGELCVVSADDAYGTECVTFAPIGRADRVYRHRALV